ncbi:hypothetical protein BDN72DRAFT_413922 [Pluteus cervinus]|uniref:Uncharacterized protein n=1 Tax=Pluteus cervinus TaxID=181527 RepID=A0ACD3B242_9AGAR|nr:hypothetical protein BDN72DRAFT_413922 [Pluteus cervinus]
MSQVLAVQTTVESEAFTRDELREQDAALLVPLALAAFGSILDIASEMDDFSLGEAEFLREQAQQWEYAQFPNSFKSSLQQLVFEGYTAFSKADFNTRSIQSVSSQIRTELEKAASVVSDARSDREIIKTVSEENLRSILRLATTCIETAAHFGKGFSTLPGLAKELAKACGMKLAVAEKVKTRLLIALKAQLKALEVRQETYQASVTETKQELFQALERVEEANKSYAASTVVQCSQSNLGFSYRHVNTRSIAEFSSEDLSVSGLLKSTAVLDVAERLSLLLGFEENSADWAQICLAEGQHSSIIHRIHEFLSKQVVYLEAHQEHAIHTELLPVLKGLLVASGDIVSLSSVAKVGHKEEAVVQKHRLAVQKAAFQIKETLASYNGQLVVPEGGRIATSMIPSSFSSLSHWESQSSVVEHSAASHVEVQIEVEEARSYFESVKSSYEKASRALTVNQQEIVKIQAEIARVTLWNKHLVLVLPQLHAIIPILERLYEQFVEIGLFFESNFVALKETLHFHTHITIWADRLFNFNRIGFAGVSNFDLTRQLIWQHIMYAWRVISLAETTANTYAEVFAWYRFDTSRLDALDYAKVDQLFKVRSTSIQSRKEAILQLFGLVERFWKWTPSVVTKYRREYFSSFKERVSVYESSLTFSSSTALALEVNCDTPKFQYFIYGVKQRQFIETYEDCDCGGKHAHSHRHGHHGARKHKNHHKSHAQVTHSTTTSSVFQETATASKIEEVVEVDKSASVSAGVVVVGAAESVAETGVSTGVTVGGGLSSNGHARAADAQSIRSARRSPRAESRNASLSSLLGL